MMRSKLPNTVLAKIWRLADYDRDGYLTEEEFALSMHLINIRLEGYPLPDELPDHLVPPSQRSKIELLNMSKNLTCFCLSH